MRIFALALGLAALGLPAGASPNVSRTRVTPLTERIPNKEIPNAYPRWLSYVMINGIDGQPQGMSIGVDSRNSVHVAAFEYPYWIRYRNDWLQDRKSNGFSNGIAIANRNEIQQGSILANVLDPADLWVEQSSDPVKNDRIHVAWGTYFRDDALPTFPKDWEDLYYRKKDASGWGTVPGAYVKLTSAPLGHYYTSPAVLVDAAGVVHVFAAHSDQTDVNPSNYTSRLVHITFNGASVTQEDIPGTTVYAIGGVRAGYRNVGGSEKMWIVWQSTATSTSTTTDARYVSRIDGSLGSATTFSTGNAVSPDVAIDSAGNPHFVWGAPAVSQVFYKNLSEAQSQVSTTAPTVSSFNSARIAVDSRDQIHVVWGGMRYAARVKNSNPDQVSTIWQRQEKIVAPRADEFDMFSLQDVALSKSDTLHVVGRDFYTRTMEYGLGVRDSAAMVPVFPGGSVNVTNGNLHARVGLFATSGVGPSQACSMLHNSLDPYPGLTSPGWRFNYEIYLTNHRLSTSEESATIFLGDGRAVHFKKSATFGYLVADDEFGVFDKLEFVDPEYRLTTKFGDTLLFNDAGKLKEMMESTGNYLEVKWDDSNGRLVFVKDMQGNGGPGRTSQVAYESGSDARYFPRVDTVTDPGSKTYKFLYTGSNLSDIKFQGHASLPTYHFDYYAINDFLNKERIGLLKTWKLPRGFPWTMKYIPDGRAAEALDPLTVSLMLTYREDQPVTATRETTYTNRRGFSWKYKVEPRRTLALEIFDPTVNPTPPTGFSQVIRQFDTYGNLTSATDRWGQVTTYEFLTTPIAPVPGHVRNNLKEVRRPLAGTNPTIRYENYTALSKPQQVTTWATAATAGTQTARVTQFQYNGFGQMTQTKFPDVTPPAGPAQSNVTMSYEFNGPRFQLTRIVNEDAHWTQFQMFSSPSGFPDLVTREGGSSGVQTQHDIMGNVTHHRVPDGGPGSDAPADTVTQYDGLWRAEFVTDPAGATSQYVFNVDNLLDEVRPPAGGVTSTTYDSRGFVTGGSSPDGSWSQTPDVHGNVTNKTNARGGQTVQTFDALDRPLSSNGPAVNTTYVHDDFVGGEHLSHVTLGGRETVTAYDARGRVIRVTEADTVTVTKTFYDEQDQVVASEIRKGGVVQTCSVSFRDARDRVDHVRTQQFGYQDTGTSNFFDVFTLYSKTGVVTKRNDPGWPISGVAHTTTYLLDARSRVEFVADGLGVVIQQNRYGDDDLVWQTLGPDPATKSETLVTVDTRTYTARKELKTSKNRNGKGLTHQYGTLPGQVSQTTDALGRVVKTNYHSTTQRPSDVTSAYGTADASSSFFEWENGLPKETRVWNPATLSYTATHGRTHDNAYRQTVVTGPLVGSETMVYDPVTGDPKEVTAQLGGVFRRVTHLFDALGRAYQSDWTGLAGGSQTREFNGLSMVTSVTDGTLEEIMAYQTWRGAPDIETFKVDGGPFRNSLIHTVDLAGNHTELSDPEAANHTWPVDVNNRPFAQTYAGQGVLSIQYTPGGFIDRTVLRNAAGTAISETVHSYDGIGRKTRSVTFKAGTTRVLTDFGWGFDDADQVTSLTLAHLGATFTFGYNFRGELVSEGTPGNVGGAGLPPYTNQIGNPSTGPESAPSPVAEGAPQTLLAIPAWTASYVVDPGGNRTSQTINSVTTTFQYNAASQLTLEDTPAHGSVPSRSVTNLYDEFGSLQRKTTVEGTTPSPTTTIETYTYDYQNLLSAYTRTVGSSLVADWQYEYWPNGERYGKTNRTTGVGELYIPRSGDVVCEYEKVGGGTPTLKNSYVQGLGLDTKTTRVPVSGGRRHYVGDKVGTHGMTLDDGAAALETSVKDVWGNQIAGASDERYSGIAQREIDGESGLVQMRARPYDPRTGRFTQNEPLLDRRPFSHFIYAGNNPVQRTDPTGLYYGVRGEVDEFARRQYFKAVGNWYGFTLTEDGGRVRIAGGSGNGPAGARDGGIFKAAVEDNIERDFIDSGDALMGILGRDRWARLMGVGEVKSVAAAAWQGWKEGEAVGWEGFKEGATFGLYEAPEWARRDPWFKYSKTVGNLTTTAVASVSAYGVGVRAVAAYRTYSAAAAAGATGVASTPQGQRALQQGFNTFPQFKNAMGPAGNKEAWHHIVEQTAGNVARFGAQAVHTLGNLVRVPNDIHTRISAYYSSIQPFTNGLTVRAWIATQSFAEQFDFGVRIARAFGAVP